MEKPRPHQGHASVALCAAADIGAFEWGAGPLVEPTFFSVQPLGPSGLALRLTSEVGRVIEIYGSSNLTTWFWLARLTNATGEVSYPDPLSSRPPARFYKAIQLP